MAAPELMKLARKGRSRYTFAPSPGPHAADKCMTLGFVLRDILGVAANAREVRELMNSRMVKVDGIVRRDPGFPLGTMDILTVGNDSWRILPGRRGYYLQLLGREESSTKLLQVTGKTFVKGRLQLNFHDGRNMLVENDVYKTGDVVVFDVAEKKLKGHVQFKRGALGLVTDGKLRGTAGRVEDILLVRGITPNKVVLKADGRTVETLKDYIFVIGQEKPLVTLASRQEGK